MSIFEKHVLYYNHINIMCESIIFSTEGKEVKKICLQDGVQGIFLFTNLPCDFNKAEL